MTNWERSSRRRGQPWVRNFINESKVDAFGLFTGQVGYAANNVLFYLKGGAAVVSDNSRVLDPTRTFVVATTNDSTRWGATVGAGIEFGFAPNWSVGVEYDHIFLEDRTHTFLNNGVLAPAGVMFGTDSISLDVDLVSVRVN
jgi:outer membrane immunogenic protein